MEIKGDGEKGNGDKRRWRQKEMGTKGDGDKGSWRIVGKFVYLPEYGTLDCHICTWLSIVDRQIG